MSDRDDSRQREAARQGNAEFERNVAASQKRFNENRDRKLDRMKEKLEPHVHAQLREAGVERKIF